MVVFAFANSQKGGGFYIASSKDSTGWLGLPPDLAQVLEDARRKGEQVEELSSGLDGDWFFRTNARHACKTQHVSAGMMSNVELFAQLAAQGGLNLQHYAIQCFTFVPDSTGYVTVLHKGDRSLSQCAWHNVPAALDQLLDREAAKGVRHVAVGVNGAYVVILNSGVVWWKGVPSSLDRLLDDAEQKGRGVESVSLSLVAADWFFVEFADGATQFVLPQQWHGAINKHTSLNVRKQVTSLNVQNLVPTMVTSFNSTPSARATPSPHHSHFGSHSSFSPINSSPNPAPVYGHTPYSPNPYVTPYAAVPQFVPSPPQFVPQQPPQFVPQQPQFVPQQPQFVPQQPQFTPQLPQQPIHVTNVYNTVAQPEKPTNGNGTVQLLGGALKVAGALIPLFTGGNNNNSGGSLF